MQGYNGIHFDESIDDASCSDVWMELKNPKTAIFNQPTTLDLWPPLEVSPHHSRDLVGRTGFSHRRDSTQDAGAVPTRDYTVPGDRPLDAEYKQARPTSW